MNEKSIAELIHERVVLEGGTLHRWLNGAKFRRIWPEPMINCKMISSPTEVEDVLGFEEFVPSPELRALMIRNADELRRYVAGLVADWRAQAPRGQGTSQAVGREDPKARGGDIRECHGDASFEISPAEPVRGGFGASSGEIAGAGGSVRPALSKGKDGK